MIRHKVFISYRSADAEASASLLRLALEDRFGKENVFFAPDSIKGGEDFEKQLPDELEQAAVIIAVIGPKWLEAGKWGIRPIDDEENWVRKEVAYGLERADVTVVPFLVNQAELPTPKEAEKALPKDLRPLASLHQIKAGPPHRPIPPELFTLIERKLNSSSRELAPHSLTLIVHSADSDVVSYFKSRPAAKDQAARFEHKNWLLETFSKELPGKVSIHADNAAIHDDEMLTKAELLTCQGAIILLDPPALESEFVTSQAAFLAWRHALGTPSGMPLVTVLLDGVSRRDLGHSRLSFLEETTVRECRHSKGQVGDHRRKFVKGVRTYLEQEFEARKNSVASDPATMWLDYIVEVLNKVPGNGLFALGEKLGLSRQVLVEAHDARRVIASALFDANLHAAANFLQMLVYKLRELDVPHGMQRGLIARALPIWVDLDAGRMLLRAAKLPEGRRLCGVRLPGLEWAQHVTNRASAGAYEYPSEYPSVALEYPPSVKLNSVAGERPVEELIERHDATLRKQLHLGDDDTPTFIREHLQKRCVSVFAVLDAKSLRQQELERIITALGKRFPGITFVLVSDQTRDKWRFHPPIGIALGRPDDEERREIASFIRASKSLVQANEGKHEKH